MATEWFVVETLKAAKGFITHEDQEVGGLRFSIVAQDASSTYGSVSGDIKPILEWMGRTGAKTARKEDVDSLIAAVVPVSDPQVLSELRSLSSRVDALEAAAGS